MALVVIGTCQTCGAQQLLDGRILLAPESKCTTHDFMKPEQEETIGESKPPVRGNMLMSMPSQKECIANDRLNEHLYKVEGKIDQTKATIQTLEERHEHWRTVMTEDFQLVIIAAENRREKLLQDLDTLVQNKSDLLHEQLAQYQHHHQACEDMLGSIFERIQTHRRDMGREQGITTDSTQTIQQFPKLIAIPIAVAGESQTQPLVTTLESFGAILESDLGRLPTVLIEEVNDSRQQIKYSVIEPDDVEEKTAVNFIPGLQVEVQATVYAKRSLGWNVAWTSRVPCENVAGTMRIDVKALPASETVYIRARTIIVNGRDPTDPIRISRWSDTVEMANNKRLPIRQDPVSPSPRQDAPTKPIFVVCVDPTSGAKLPCRPAAPDYVSQIKNAAIKKFKWGCSLDDIALKIVQKTDESVVCDLSSEVTPNTLLADVWDRNNHFIHVIQTKGESVEIPHRSPSPMVPAMEVAEPADINWPKRLMIRIKEQPTRDSPARPSPLRIEDRVLPGGWLGALQKRYCERFSLEQEGDMHFFFVDDEGNRVKDITRDADFLYVQENRKRVYAVGERA